MMKERSRIVRKFRNIVSLGIFFNILIKNQKLLIRSKTSALIVLLGPLLITFLVGASFNTSSIYDIRIGAYSTHYSDLTDALLTELSDKQFTVVKYDSEEQCIQNLKLGGVHVCATFPQNLAVGVNEPVVFHVDNSRMNLVWVIIDTISTKVQVKSSQLSLQLTQTVLDALVDTRNKLVDKNLAVNDLANKTVTNQNQLSQVSGELASINLELNDAGIGDIRRDLQRAITNYNLSSVYFTDVWSSVSRAENKSVDINNELAQIAGVRDTAVTTLLDLGNSMISNLEIINALESTINDVQKKIDGVTVTSAETIVTPIKTKITPLSIEKTHLNFLFPTLVILIIMFISVLLASLHVVREKSSNAYFRNFITPVGDFFFLLGDFSTNLIIVLLQLVVIFSVAAFFFKGSLIFAILYKALFCILVIISVFVLIGMVIGYLFKSEEMSTLAAISFASLALFFSSTILPLEALPSYIKDIAKFNPFVLSENLLKGILLFNATLKDLSEWLGLLGFYIFILIIFVYMSRRFSKYSNS